MGSPPVGNTPPTPFITVLVTAHRRREFLRQAVDSLIAQDLPRSEFEVVVIKDFADGEIDGYIESVGMRQVRTDAVALGAKVASGIQLARGDVIAFLEDDDAYEPRRLSTVARHFRSNNALGYYRNGQFLIGERGDPLPASAYGPANRNLQQSGPIYAGPEGLGHVLGAIARVDPDFNLSSIAVRRSLIQPLLESLREQRAAVDSFVFYGAATASAGILIDPDPLTRYRVHGSNLSLWRGDPEVAAVQRATYQKIFLESFRPIYERTLGPGPRGARQLAGSAYFGTWVLYRLLTSEGGRASLRKDLQAFWASSPAGVLLYRRDITAWGLYGLVAPRRARRAFLRRRTEESRRSHG